MRKDFTIYTFKFFALLCFVSLQAQDCPPAENLGTLSGNNVSAGVSSSATMFWDFSNTTYEVPAGSGKNAIFAASPWMGGIDALGQLKVAANTYRQTGADYFPGPITESGEAVCGFDEVYTVSKVEIDDFITANYTNPSENILNWPARNNQVLIDQGLEMDFDLAPFFDSNGDNIYNPTDGDYPLVKGDNNVWRIFNDAGGEHTETDGQIIGMEIKSLGYSFNTDDYLNNTTFWDFELNYKGEANINDFYFGFWVDPDLGNYTDDYVGCNPENNTAYVYNGDAFDDGAAGYGDEVPALAVTFLKGLKDNEGTDVGMSSFMKYVGDFAVTGNPETAEHFYNFMKASWKDGTPLTYGGDGYGGTETTNFLFPDSPNNPDGWSECALGTTPADRRFIMGTGPITLEPGEKQLLTVGINFGTADNFEYPCPDINTWINSYKEDMVAHIENIETELEAIVSTHTVTHNIFSISPNPTSDFINIDTNLDFVAHSASIFNVEGKQVKQCFLSAEQHQSIELNDLDTGIYFLKVYDKESRLLANEKLVVMK